MKESRLAPVKSGLRKTCCDSSPPHASQGCGPTYAAAIHCPRLQACSSGSSSAGSTMNTTCAARRAATAGIVCCWQTGARRTRRRHCCKAAAHSSLSRETIMAWLACCVLLAKGSVGIAENNTHTRLGQPRSNASETDEQAASCSNSKFRSKAKTGCGATPTPKTSTSATKSTSRQEQTIKRRAWNHHCRRPAALQGKSCKPTSAVGCQDEQAGKHIQSDSSICLTEFLLHAEDSLSSRTT